MNSSKNSSQSNEVTPKPKTHKRELAVIMLLAIFIMAFLGMIEAIAILAPPVFLFSMAVFGLDWASKQTDLTNRVDK